MTGIDSWSITPATNATADAGSINWAEGQAPSTVNNTARQMLTDTRAAFNDLVWFQYGTGDQGAGNIAVPAVYSSGTVFTIAGADVTTIYTVGRRVRAVGSGTGTIYGSITITSYAPTTTTVTAKWDSGSLSNETLVISLSQVPATGKPISPLSIRTPAFLVWKDVSQTNITGAGTLQTVTWPAEIYDLGSNFAGNQFTAPATGIYHFSGSVLIGDMTTAMTGFQLTLVTSNRTYVFNGKDGASVASGTISMPFSIDADMDAADTAYTNIQVSGGAGDTADALGHASLMYSFFSGHLVAGLS